jgi:hypothetical protein
MQTPPNTGIQVTRQTVFDLMKEWDQWLESVRWTAKACGEKTGYFTTFGALADRADAVSEWMHRHSWDSSFAGKVMSLLADMHDARKRFNCEFPAPPQSLVEFVKTQVKAPLPLIDY